MDARGRELSQSRRLSIKRPWEEDEGLPEAGSGWHSALLPPIDAVPYQRPSIARGAESGVTSNISRYGPEIKESVSKKARHEGSEYNGLRRDSLDLDGTTPQFRATKPMYIQNRGSQESPPFPQKQTTDRWGKQGGDSGGPADFQDISNLCRRCRRLTTHNSGYDLFGIPEECEDCKRNPELAWVTQAAAAGLTQLAETLSSGISSERRGVIRGPEQRRVGSADCPPIAQFGLKQTLNWILGRINHVNSLADQFVDKVPPDTLQNHDQNIPKNGQVVQDDIMKRRIDVDSSDDAVKSREDVLDSTSDAKLHTRRRSLTTAIPVGEELPPMRSRHDYQPPNSSMDGAIQGASIMNPPPAPNRQLPSPPGRSFPSPTSLEFPSPSARSYGSTSQPINLPPPSSLHQSTINNYLPPIASTHSSDTALRDHSAALQHEVSVQKIALSSLQGEHDKLLAAFSRSQTRASALEKKHAVSDSEIISLTEEKLRLQAQVIELERDVEELGRSRDEFRQAAVQEGSQYVEIVKKASRLEEMAGEERKGWNKLKTEMEQRIEALSSASTRKDGAISTVVATPLPRMIDDIDTPASSVDVPTDLKIEPISEPHPIGPTSYPGQTQTESEEDLKEEIRQLRARCAEVESALAAVRDDSRSMETIVEALGLAGKSIMERADRTLGGVAED